MGYWTSVLHRGETPPSLAATAGETGPRSWLSRRSLKRPSPASTRVRFSSTHHPHLHPSLPSRALLAFNLDGNSTREHVGHNVPRLRPIVAPKAPVKHEARPTSNGGAWGACRRVSEVNRGSLVELDGASTATFNRKRLARLAMELMQTSVLVMHEPISSRAAHAQNAPEAR
ncbi:hypothetical protein HYPSUDRAFT_207930 [Hypholoma sublateritium FD-334 SS-4]|uniref:Uncharacterized protein n=1 Tax=Hypholoma sublateritium (strain FD-334 SS-4) TaxID=945553 RepID=A0A0D2N8G1_HYPSF|nr:hypothetical protein HYPSUDRAFT_207930 [Hypholoma sublateritium FD-334 SS-4]